MNHAAFHKKVQAENPDADAAQLFRLRWATNLSLIHKLFFSVYGQEGTQVYFDGIYPLLEERFSERKAGFKSKDLERVENPQWFQSNNMVGMQLYVEHFNGDLKGLGDKIPYLQWLGINFLHLMPLTKRPAKNNDGGYAVNSHSEIDSSYGTVKDWTQLRNALDKAGISIMLDFVVNHTADSHPWAKKAIRGIKKYQDFYHICSNREVPDQFERTLPEVFPQTAPGNFTYNKKMDRWVMTVFNNYQWDLNYANPEVFLEMLDELIKLVNLGVDVVRFDALAFIWKKIGTTSQNLEQAHNLISLFKACLQVLAPGAKILAEAIMAPKDIISYFGENDLRGNECDLAYNASYMALLWNSIATKKSLLLRKGLLGVPEKPRECSWINYIRCHDDIGLGIDDNHISSMGWNPFEHRKFLLDYYGQQLSWSPAKGQLFMFNPKTGDGRITGSAASLLGLEKAIESKNSEGITASIKKIRMMYGLVMAFPGIPIIYSGDEIGLLNDYTYLKNAHKKEDSRWLNRPKMDWGIVKDLGNKTPQSNIWESIAQLTQIRKQQEVLTDRNNLKPIDLGNDHLFSFERMSISGKEGILVLVNFDDSPHVLSSHILDELGYVKKGVVNDLLSDKAIRLTKDGLNLKPYMLYWLKKQG